VSLLADAGAGGVAAFHLTNPDLPGPDGVVRVRKETLSIRQGRPATARRPARAGARGAG
jgi:hypothetical protein